LPSSPLALTGGEAAEQERRERGLCTAQAGGAQSSVPIIDNTRAASLPPLPGPRDPPSRVCVRACARVPAAGQVCIHIYQGDSLGSGWMLSLLGNLLAPAAPSLASH
jgi:hypothetical protein